MGFLVPHLDFFNLYYQRASRFLASSAVICLWVAGLGTACTPKVFSKLSTTASGVNSLGGGGGTTGGSTGGPNTAPSAEGQLVGLMPNTTRTVSLVGRDPEGDDLTSVVVIPPVNGTLNPLGPLTYDYTPNAGFSGADSFSYKVNDGALDSAVAVVSLSVKSTFSAVIPVPDTAVPFRLPTRAIELIVGHSMNPMDPFDANSGSIYNFLLEGTLPSGLNFTASSGRIAGTPSAADYRVVKVCRDPKVGSHDCQDLHIIVKPEISITGHTSVDPLLCPAVSGVGTRANPIVVTTVAEMECIRNYPHRAFRLGAMIDFNFTPFVQLPTFTGYLDGNGFMIRRYVSSSGKPLFAGIQGEAIIRNLTLSEFTITNGTGGNGVGALSPTLAGGLLEDITLSQISISGDVHLGALVGRVIQPVGVQFYHGSMDRITLDTITINASGPWSRSGGLIGLVQHTPFRISNVRMMNTSSISGNSFLGALMGQSWSDITPADYANLWLDRIDVGAGTTVSGSAFASGLVASMNYGDVLTNSASRASVTGSNQGGAGLLGVAYNKGNGQCSHVVNSYFAGALSFSSDGGIIAGNNYGTGSVMIVNTASLSTLSPPVTNGIGVISISNMSITDAQFRDPAHSTFSTWAAPPWIFSIGSYPLPL